MNTLTLLVALFLKLNSIYGGMNVDYGTDYASTAAWLEKIKPVYYEMGLVTLDDVVLVERERPANIPDDVSVWVSGPHGLFEPVLYYAVGEDDPLSLRAGVAHDFLQTQSNHLGKAKGAAKVIQYENVAELGAMAALATMANRGDVEAKDVLTHMLWERSIVSTLYQALLSGGVEEAENLLASYNLDEGTFNRFHRVIELYQEQPKTSRTLNSMYYNGVFDKVFAAEDGIVTGIGTRSGTLDVSDLLKFIDKLTRKPPIPKLMGRHSNEYLDRWTGCLEQ